MVPLDVPAMVRKARAMRLHARGHRFLLARERERRQAAQEHVWAVSELARMDLHDRLEDLNAIRYASHRDRLA